MSVTGTRRCHLALGISGARVKLLILHSALDGLLEVRTDPDLVSVGLALGEESREGGVAGLAGVGRARDGLSGEKHEEEREEVECEAHIERCWLGVAVCGGAVGSEGGRC